MNIDQKMEEVLGILRKRHWTIGVMESCTGGAIANAVTNIPGASDVFKCGKVTYSDDAKIEAGVYRKVIDGYSVFSMEVAKEMAKKIKGDIGVGVTGNFPGEVFVAVRIKDQVKSIKLKVESEKENIIEARKEMKREVVERVLEILSNSL
jgi:nicotinamide-nucleotide amidase